MSANIKPAPPAGDPERRSDRLCRPCPVTPLKRTAAIALLTLAVPMAAAAVNEPGLIPRPRHVERQAGFFRLAPDTRIYTDPASAKTGAFLAARLTTATGHRYTTSPAGAAGKIADGILLTTGQAKKGLGPEGYALTVTPARVVIRAPTPAGLFYGVQTLLQLLPPEIYATHAMAKVDWRAPCVAIEDWPRFPWRGLMLDVSRHFFSKAEVEKILDEMARLKLNRFHWHLTDDQGWRLAIPRYPRLTQVGAWRTGSELTSPKGGEAADHVHGNARPSWDAPSRDKFGPDGRYGGYYTAADIREVVEYAAARHITIVPEIEMPGHAVAALAAYPGLSCDGGPYSTDVPAGVNAGVFDPGNPATFEFLGAVLTEVCRLFPGPYIHVGGDEVNARVKAATWARSARCRALMRREGLKTVDALQAWFTRRIEKMVEAHGRRLVGWDEIAGDGIGPGAVIMAWRGGGREAAAAGHDVVMTPMTYCYFDRYQSRHPAAEPHAIGGTLPTRQVYAFEPIPAGLPPQDDAHILGAQANLWTEYIPSLAYAQYMIFPRLCALAEVDWSPKAARNWADFQRRLQVEKRRLAVMGVNYRHDSARERRAQLSR